MSSKSNPIIVGLDVGTTKIVAIAGRKNAFGKIEIVGRGKAVSSGVEHGTVMNIKHCSEAIKAALHDCKAKYPALDIKDVYVGIAGKHIRSYQFQADITRTNKEDVLIDQSDIDTLIEIVKMNTLPDGEVLIDIVPQEFMIDNEQITHDPIGATGNKMVGNFHVITGARNDVKKIKMCLDFCQLNTRDLVLQPLASAAAVLTEEDFENGVCMVDIGGGTTDIAVFYDKVLYHTAVIGKAGVNITKEIQEICEMSYQNAELLKLNGSAIPEEHLVNTYIKVKGTHGMPDKSISKYNLSKIIEAGLTPIFEEIKRHLDVLDLSRKIKSGIILTGGGSQMKNIVQLCEFVTKINTRLGFPNEHITGGVEEEINNPMYATCIGLILRGYEDFESKAITNNNFLYQPLEPQVLPHTAQIARAEDTVLEEMEKKTQQKAKKSKDLFDGLFGIGKKRDKQSIAEDADFQADDEDTPVEAVKKTSTRNKMHIGNIINTAKNKFLHLFEDEPEDEEL